MLTAAPLVLGLPLDSARGGSQPTDQRLRRGHSRCRSGGRYGLGYREPADAYFARLSERLPADIRAELGEAIGEGVLLIDGWRFRLAGLPASKGPYALFSRNREPELPAPNWEYYVQVAEYVRVRRALEPLGYEVGFEDGLMDVSVRRGGHLVWCIEVKEKAAKLSQLLVGLESYAQDVPMDAPDRGLDALRKAKYLIRHRPGYLSLVAIGSRIHFAVDYPSDRSFVLTPSGAEPDLKA